MKFVFDPSAEEMQKAVDDHQGFVIHGLQIESAEFDANDKRIKMTSKLSSPLPTVLLKWVRKTEQDSGVEQVELPLYLNRLRKQLLCSIKIETQGISAQSWYQRGVALFAGNY